MNCLLCGKLLPINGRGSAKMQPFVCKKCQASLLKYDLKRDESGAILRTEETK